MKTSIRTLSLAFVFLCVTVSSISANDSTASPAQFTLKSFIKASVQFMNNKNMNADMLLQMMANQNSTAKVCVCEIMELKSNNYQFQNVAVLSEKTNNGDLTADYKSASKLLSKERKHMKDFFFDVIKVTEKFTAATDCVSLYLMLRRDAVDLKLYDILDADIVRVK
jgi:hypothetical protein